MDPAAPKTVAQGVALTSVTCGFATGLYGTLKGHSPGRLSLFAALNGSIAAVTFFSIREYIVGPVLTLTHPGKQYQSRRRELKNIVDGLPREEQPLSWSDVRTFRLLDSAISGAMAGGILNVWKRGRVGFMPGLGTGALVCTLLQWSANEFNILRISYVSRKTTVSSHMTQPPGEESWGDRVFSLFGRRVSDGDYLNRLRAERDAHLRRIEELEKDLGPKPKS
ncbi:hypothetical protein ID866_3236 [Astraeus odoratus]|nr:hypothetical protein ID866_3236 [Astraeus odoratus]